MRARFVAIAFWSSKEHGAPLRIIYSAPFNVLDVCGALHAMGADYVRAYDNENCYDRRDSEGHATGEHSWTWLS